MTTGLLYFITSFNILWKDCAMEHMLGNTIQYQKHLSVEAMGSTFTIILISPTLTLHPFLPYFFQLF